ncbi:MAG: DUF222 domain-containing protein [Acidimicrobiia bacterium]
MPAGPLGQKLLDLQGEINRLEARFVARLREFDRSGEWKLDGMASPQAWLRHHGRMTGPAASSRVKVARRLVELPRTTEAFDEGVISRDHVAVIVSGTELTDGLDGSTRVDRAEIEQAIAAGEEIFVDSAREMDPSNLRRVATHFRHAVEPQVVVADEVESVARRSLHMSQSLDGRFHLKGEFDVEGGTIVRTALDSLMVPGGTDSEVADPADTPPRSASRRRADALVATCEKALSTGELPSTGGERPQVSVVVDLETLTRLAGVPAAELEDGALSAVRLLVASPATPVWCGSSPTASASRSTWVARCRRCPPTSDGHSSYGMAGAPGRDVTDRPAGPTHITSSTGRTAATPASRISCCSAGLTTPRSTSTAGP